MPKSWKKLHNSWSSVIYVLNNMTWSWWLRIWYAVHRAFEINPSCLINLFFTETLIFACTNIVEHKTNLWAFFSPPFLLYSLLNRSAFETTHSQWFWKQSQSASNASVIFVIYEMVANGKNDHRFRYLMIVFFFYPHLTSSLVPLEYSLYYYQLWMKMRSSLHFYKESYRKWI